MLYIYIIYIYTHNYFIFPRASTWQAIKDERKYRHEVKSLKKPLGSTASSLLSSVLSIGSFLFSWLAGWQTFCPASLADKEPSMFLLDLAFVSYFWAYTVKVMPIVLRKPQEKDQIESLLFARWFAAFIVFQCCPKHPADAKVPREGSESFGKRERRENCFTIFATQLAMASD